MTVATIQADDYKYRVRIINPTNDYWSWACNRFPKGTWMEMVSLLGSSVTFCFRFEEDLLIFKLAHGL